MKVDQIQQTESKRLNAFKTGYVTNVTEICDILKFLNVLSYIPLNIFRINNIRSKCNYL